MAATATNGYTTFPNNPTTTTGSGSSGSGNGNGRGNGGSRPTSPRPLSPSPYENENDQSPDVDFGAFLRPVNRPASTTGTTVNVRPSATAPSSAYYSGPPIAPEHRAPPRSAANGGVGGSGGGGRIRQGAPRLGGLGLGGIGVSGVQMPEPKKSINPSYTNSKNKNNRSVRTANGTYSTVGNGNGPFNNSGVGGGGGGTSGVGQGMSLAKLRQVAPTPPPKEYNSSSSSSSSAVHDLHYLPPMTTTTKPEVVERPFLSPEMPKTTVREGAFALNRPVPEALPHTIDSVEERYQQTDSGHSPLQETTPPATPFLIGDSPELSRTSMRRDSSTSVQSLSQHLKNGRGSVGGGGGGGVDELNQGGGGFSYLTAAINGGTGSGTPSSGTGTGSIAALAGVGGVAAAAAATRFSSVPSPPLGTLSSEEEDDEEEQKHSVEPELPPSAQQIRRSLMESRYTSPERDLSDKQIKGDQGDEQELLQDHFGSPALPLSKSEPHSATAAGVNNTTSYTSRGSHAEAVAADEDNDALSSDGEFEDAASAAPESVHEEAEDLAVQEPATFPMSSSTQPASSSKFLSTPIPPVDIVTKPKPVAESATPVVTSSSASPRRSSFAAGTLAAMVGVLPSFRSSKVDPKPTAEAQFPPSQGSSLPVKPLEPIQTRQEKATLQPVQQTAQLNLPPKQTAANTSLSPSSPIPSTTIPLYEDAANSDVSQTSSRPPSIRRESSSRTRGPPPPRPKRLREVNAPGVIPTSSSAAGTTQQQGRDQKDSEEDLHKASVNPVNAERSPASKRASMSLRNLPPYAANDASRPGGTAQTEAYPSPALSSDSFSMQAAQGVVVESNPLSSNVPSSFEANAQTMDYAVTTPTPQSSLGTRRTSTLYSSLGLRLPSSISPSVELSALSYPLSFGAAATSPSSVQQSSSISPSSLAAPNQPLQSASPNVSTAPVSSTPTPPSQATPPESKLSAPALLLSQPTGPAQVESLDSESSSFFSPSPANTRPGSVAEPEHSVATFPALDNNGTTTKTNERRSDENSPEAIVSRNTSTHDNEIEAAEGRNETSGGSILATVGVAAVGAVMTGGFAVGYGAWRGLSAVASAGWGWKSRSQPQDTLADIVESDTESTDSPHPVPGGFGHNDGLPKEAQLKEAYGETLKPSNVEIARQGTPLTVSSLNTGVRDPPVDSLSSGGVGSPRGNDSSVLSPEWEQEGLFPAPLGFKDEFKRIMEELGPEDMFANDQMEMEAQEAAYQAAMKLHKEAQSPSPTFYGPRTDRQQASLDPREAGEGQDDYEELMDMMAPLLTFGDDGFSSKSRYKAPPGLQGMPRRATSLPAADTMSIRSNESQDSKRTFLSPNTAKSRNLFGFSSMRRSTSSTSNLSINSQKATSTIPSRNRAMSIESAKSSSSDADSKRRSLNFFGGGKSKAPTSIESQINDMSYVSYTTGKSQAGRNSASPTDDSSTSGSLGHGSPPLGSSSRPTRRSSLKKVSSYNGSRAKGPLPNRGQGTKTMYSVRFGNATRGLGLRSVAEDEAVRGGGDTHAMKWIGVGNGRYGNLVIKNDAETDEHYAEQAAQIKRKWRAFGAQQRDWSGVKID